MYCCLICLYSLEFSSDSSVAIKDCGHVFHSNCITQWLHTNPQHKNCPKCRREISESSLIKLYFGKSSNNDEQQELNQEITDLLDETELCRNRILIDMNTIQQNSKEIAAKKRKIVSNENEFKLKNLAILLSRTDELRRIQDYYDSLQ